MTLIWHPKLPAGSRMTRQVGKPAATLVAGGRPFAWHPEKRLKNCYMKPWRSHYD
jgi:hypothetical protein